MGGGLNMVELPPLLNIDLSVIERAIPDILGESDDLIALGGELITKQYLSNVVREVVQLLKERGSLSVADLAKRFCFTTMFVMDLLSKAIDKGTLHAVLDEAALYTPQFVYAQKVIIRSAILAAMRPTMLRDLCERHRLYRALFPQLVEELARDNELPGRVEGGGATGQYVPACYEEARQDSIHSFYSSNLCVPYSMLVSEGVANPKVFMTSRYNPSVSAGAATGGKKRRGKGAKPAATSPTTEKEEQAVGAQHPLWGHALSNCFLSDRAIESLGPVLEQVASGELPSADLADYLPHHAAMEGADREIIIQRIQALFGEACEKVQFPAGSFIVSQSCFDALLPQLRVVAQEDIQNGALPNKKKLMLMLGHCVALSQDDVNLENLFTSWEPAINNIYREVREQSSASTSLTALKKVRLENEEFILKLWSEVYQFQKGLRAASSSSHFTPATLEAMHKHTIQQRGFPIVRHLVLDAAMDCGDVYEEIREIPSVKEMITHFPEDRVSGVRLLASILDLKLLDDFIESLEDLSQKGEVHVCLHAPNKKVEREIFAKLVHEMKAELLAVDLSSATTSEIAGAFSLLCTLILSEYYRALLIFPGKVVSNAVLCMKAEGIPVAESVEACQKAVVECIASKGAHLREVCNMISDLRQSL